MTISGLSHHAIFEDGWLTLDGESRAMRVRWQPDPVAELWLAGSVDWEPVRPDFRLVGPDLPAAFTKFRTQVPEPVARVAEPFDNHQWGLMLLAASGPAGLDLAMANPVLAYMLGNNEVIRRVAPPVPALAAVRHARRKQREIAGWLGFPSSEAVVRLLKRIPPDLVTPSLLRRLQTGTHSPEVLKVLSHLPALNTGVIYLVGHWGFRGVVEPRLLHEVAESPDEARLAVTAEQLGTILQLQEELHPDRPVVPLLSRARVNQVHDELMREHEVHVERERQRMAQMPVAVPVPQPDHYVRRRAATVMYRGQRVFPPPPLEGTEQIIPLMCWADIREEGSQQGNCVYSGGYGKRVLGGKFYLYRVLVDGRHTLSLSLRANNRWVICEFKGPGNRAASSAARATVHAWLMERQMKP